MSYAICLDQNTPNFNVNTLSANGFSIYTNLDLQNPIYQGIPYTQLFQPPIGNCPFLVTVPQGGLAVNFSDIHLEELIEVIEADAELTGRLKDLVTVVVEIQPATFV